jgi:hypothetical protein
LYEFFKDIVKEIGNEYAGLVSDGVAAGDCDSFIDTGSYIFNALVSGSIFGGIPSNKITAIAGESLLVRLSSVCLLLNIFSIVILMQGLFILNLNLLLLKSMIEERGIDSKRMIIVPVVTVQEFRTQALRIVDKYIEQKGKGSPTLNVCS